MQLQCIVSLLKSPCIYNAAFLCSSLHTFLQHISLMSNCTSAIFETRTRDCFINSHKMIVIL